MKKSVFSYFKKLIVAISPYLKYLMLFFIACYPSKDLYFELFDAYVNKYMFLSAYFSVCILLTYYEHKNKELANLGWGRVAYNFLAVELFFFALFAQHYLIVAVLIVTAIIGFSIWIHWYVEKHCRKGKEKYHNRANAAVCLLMCIALLVPSFVGMGEEYFSSMDTEEWEDFVASFRTDYGGKTDEDLFRKYEEVVRELDSWAELDTDERVLLLNKIVLIEKENLGIESADFIVTTDKLGESTYGYYSDEENLICLSISQISNESMEENIRTVCHETFHAYEYYVVENIDFDSEMVKNNFYFESARRWKSNIEKYVPATVDYDMYFTQPLEADARKYAQSRVEAYLAILETY